MNDERKATGSYGGPLVDRDDETPDPLDIDNPTGGLVEPAPDALAERPGEEVDPADELSGTDLGGLSAGGRLSDEVAVGREEEGDSGEARKP